MSTSRSIKNNFLVRKHRLSAFCTRAGLMISISLIGYFFLMRAFQLHEILLLRGFNFLFLAAGILYVLQRSSKMAGGKIDYFTGLRLGMQVTAVASISFAIFLGIYLSADTAFMIYLQQKFDTGKSLIPSGAAVAVAMEGLSSGFIFTFIAMSYFKKES